MHGAYVKFADHILKLFYAWQVGKRSVDVTDAYSENKAYLIRISACCLAVLCLL